MDYLPTKEADKRDWYSNLKTEIAGNATALGLATAEVTAVEAICTSKIAAIDDSNTAQTAAKTAKAAKDTQLGTGDKQLRAVIRKMKTSAGYTDSIGTQLRIIGEDNSIDFTSYKPTIKATVMPGKVRIDFVKDTLDGVNVYARLKGQTTWTKLAYDSYTPYDDTRPIAAPTAPEHREYMAIGVLHDEEVTKQSDIIEAVFGG